MALTAPALAVAAPAEAAKGMKGFNTLRDTGDGYELIYPFGWQEVSVQGVDAVFKDVIEPLESCAVQLVPTEKKTISEYGNANEIAGTLARSVLTSGNDDIQLIQSNDETSGGRCGALPDLLVNTSGPANGRLPLQCLHMVAAQHARQDVQGPPKGLLERSSASAASDHPQVCMLCREYVSFEFLQKAKRFTRHVLATATVANGNLMLFTIGAGEKRWPKLKDRLSQSAQSFKGFERFSTS